MTILEEFEERIRTLLLEKNKSVTKPSKKEAVAMKATPAGMLETLYEDVRELAADCEVHGGVDKGYRMALWYIAYELRKIRILLDTNKEQQRDLIP